MRKKFVSGVVTMMAAVSLMATTVLAAPSVSATQEIVTSKDTVKSDSVITVGGESLTVSEAVEQGKVELTFKEPTKEVFAEAGVPEAVVEEILSINTDTEKAAAVLESAVAAATEDVKVEASSLSMLTSLQELSFVDKAGNAIKDAKDVTLTWKAPVTTNMTVDNVRVLHYSIVKGAWELIKPQAIDPVTGEITAFFTDLSPVAIVYVTNDTPVTEQPTTDNNKVVEDTTTPATDSATVTETVTSTETATVAAESAGSNISSTPKTGDTTNAAVYVIVAALALVCGGTVVLTKKRKRA